MTMVGLFWITPDAVYVGSPPTAVGGGVRLTADGLEALDPGGSRTWTWEGLRSAVIEDVPTENPSGRVAKLLGSVVSAAAGAFIGEGPTAMTLRLETEDGPQQVTVYSAAAGGYGAEETALSQDLLARFVAGTADLRALEAWGCEHGQEATPKPHARKALLQTWTQE
ncbi:hypothetical protein G9272_44635 [Streptomyces asoensis]|uniref:Uncharacterized protein n=1 Tax=Streptomyces asoensis TaxID=249586 RepID=A0A6M4WET3_9ACTN|nr:hypothetical protein [Streptomyces asoensis]QJS98963.1 hypothetical protein G9272_00260 [Streptomyces asoensis]QJT06506.1 hypothetical protein G9272_44635 [Streptomyces asoensis]